MAGQLMIKVDKPIASAVLQGNAPRNSGAFDNEQKTCDQTANIELQAKAQLQMQELESQTQLFTQAYDTFQTLIAKLNRTSNDLYMEHKEEIAKLSVEIARKVLCKRIEDGDYDIEQIIKDTLSNAPASDNLTLHLNPEDLAMLKSASKELGRDIVQDGVRLIADANMGRAECLLESPKGKIESRINENLEQIANALKKA